MCIEARNGEYGGICLLDIQCLTFTHSKLLDKKLLCLFHSFSFTCSFSLKCCRCWGVFLSYTRFERVCEHICVSIHITHSETTKCSVLTVVRHNVCSLSIEHSVHSETKNVARNVCGLCDFSLINRRWLHDHGTLLRNCTRSSENCGKKIQWKWINCGKCCKSDKVWVKWREKKRNHYGKS